MTLPELATASLSDQFIKVWKWNIERGWGFSDEEFSRIDLTPGQNSGFVVDMIAIYLPNHGRIRGVERTFNELWELARRQQPHSWRWPDFRTNGRYLRNLKGIRNRPGLRRVKLDLGAHWDGSEGMLPANVRGPQSAHAEVLAAAAYFPEWARAMDGVRVPFAWMPGYQVNFPRRTWTRPGSMDWRCVPYLAWNAHDNALSLGGYEGDISSPIEASFACPELV